MTNRTKFYSVNANIHITHSRSTRIMNSVKVMDKTKFTHTVQTLSSYSINSIILVQAKQEKMLVLSADMTCGRPLLPTAESHVQVPRKIRPNNGIGQFAVSARSARCLIGHQDASCVWFLHPVTLSFDLFNFTYLCPGKHLRQFPFFCFSLSGYKPVWDR